MLLRFVVLLCAGHAVAWSAKASLVGLGKEPEPSHLQPTITASAMLGGVRPTGIRVPHQVILVHPSDDLVSVLSYASSGDVLLLASGVYTPAATGDFGLQINKNITIAAQQTGQAVLDGQNERTVLSITAGFVHLKGLNITNGVGTQVGGGIFISGGTVAIETSQIFSNTASFRDGGGIFISGGTVAIETSQIFSNTASGGGGIYIEGIGTVNIIGSTINNNQAVDGGGGFEIAGGSIVNINDCAIHNNQAVSVFGGGIAVFGGTVNINDCAIDNNQAKAWEGGGIYIFGSGTVMTITSTSIYENTATNGGGVYIGGYAATTVSNCTIRGNQAASGGGIYVEHGAQVKLDNQSVVTSNKPDGCYGFWSWPACKQ
mmetsp:Transcript_39928/g.104917  ORF Transcript_39928/g.104917 Transcript_39928/m.104917 type:complete len:374 (+) Transcript_39928:369-1490(+)